MNRTSINLIKGMANRHRHSSRVKLTLCMAIWIGFSLSLMVGETHYSFLEVFRALTGEHTQFAINQLRLPRALGAILVGIAFGASGSVFQGLLRNPLASPDMIGISSGASVAAVFCILILHLSGLRVALVALIFGLIVAMVIYSLASRGHFSSGRVILVGIGLQAMLNALISYMLLHASQYDIPAAMRWLSGSLNGVQMHSLGGLAIVVPIVFILLGYLDTRLQILAYGDEIATSLGVEVSLTRHLLIVCSVLLVSFATALSGPIAFVALLSGPVSKYVTRGQRADFLTAGLTGALLVLFADFVGQHVLSIQYPVGVITGALGAPYMLITLIQYNRKGADYA